MTQRPLGIKPKYIYIEELIELHAEERMKELRCAINRYLSNGLIVPKEWLEEYFEYADKLLKKE